MLLVVDEHAIWKRSHDHHMAGISTRRNCSSAGSIDDSLR